MAQNNLAGTPQFMPGASSGYALGPQDPSMKWRVSLARSSGSQGLHNWSGLYHGWQPEGFQPPLAIPDFGPIGDSSPFPLLKPALRLVPPPGYSCPQGQPAPYQRFSIAVRNEDATAVLMGILHQLSMFRSRGRDLYWNTFTRDLDLSFADEGVMTYIRQARNLLAANRSLDMVERALMAAKRVAFQIDRGRAGSHQLRCVPNKAARVAERKAEREAEQKEEEEREHSARRVRLSPGAGDREETALAVPEPQQPDASDSSVPESSPDDIEMSPPEAEDSVQSRTEPQQPDESDDIMTDDSHEDSAQLQQPGISDDTTPETGDLMNWSPNIVDNSSIEFDPLSREEEERLESVAEMKEHSGPGVDTVELGILALNDLMQRAVI